MFIANVRFLSPEQGGRRTPPQSGYHPQVKVGAVYTSCEIRNSDTAVVFEFDKEYRVVLRLLLPELYGHLIAPGSLLSFYEGHHLVGKGIVLERQEG